MYVRLMPCAQCVAKTQNTRPAKNLLPEKKKADLIEQL